MKIQTKDLNIVVVEKEAIDIYIDFIRLIKSTLQKPYFFQDYSRDELISFLDHNSYIYLFRYHNVYISSCMIIPTNKKYSFQKENEKVVEFGPQTVFEDVRGNGIQSYMIERLFQISRDLGYDYAVINIDQKDIYSYHNVLDCGFLKIGEIKEGNGIKNTYYKDIRK